MNRKLEYINAAAKAHTNLNSFAAVQAILECGVIYASSTNANITAQKIIKICKAQMQKELSAYDDAVAKAST